MGKNKSADDKPIKDLLTEQDAFLSTSEKALEFFLCHTRGIIVAGVAVFVGIIAIAFYFNYQANVEVQVTMAYEDALALNFVGQTDLAIPILALEKIKKDYATYKVGRLAAFDLVGLYGANGELEKAQAQAEELLHSLKDVEASFKPLLLNSLGSLYEANGDYLKAIKSYEVLLTLVANNPTLKENVMVSLARVQVAAGQKDEAIRQYKGIIAFYPTSFNAFLANYYLAKLKGEVVAFPLPGDKVAMVEEPAVVEVDTSQENEGTVAPSIANTPAATGQTKGTESVEK